MRKEAEATRPSSVTAKAVDTARRSVQEEGAGLPGAATPHGPSLQPRHGQADDAVAAHGAEALVVEEEDAGVAVLGSPAP